MIFDKIIKDENEVKSIVKETLSNNSNLLLTYFNQNCYNQYILHSKYRKLIDKRFTVYLDGIGMYFALKYLGYEAIMLQILINIFLICLRKRTKECS